MSDIPDGLIEIHDSEIDPDAILAQIRERVAARRAEAGYETRHFPTFGIAEAPEEPKGEGHDPNLYYYLRLANDGYARLDTAEVLAPSPATRVPVLGRVWGLIRSQVHQLVLFYVNRTVTQQVTVNRYLVSVINRLTAQSQSQQEAIAALQAEVAALRATRGE